MNKDDLIVNKLVMNGYQMQEKTMKSKKYMVTPVVMLTEGVLNDILYPYNEIMESTSLWNGIPVTINHPKGNQSANKIDVLEESGVGFVYNTEFLENEDGTAKLKAEIWFDSDDLMKIAPDVYERLTRSEVIEVSTGLRLQADEIKAEFNGEKFSYVGHNFKPDHLAVLPYQKGACSIENGCGIRNNQKTEGVLENKFEAIVNNAEKTGKLYIYGGIMNDGGWFAEEDDVTVKYVKQELDKLNDVENLEIFINSPGGSAFAGLTIYTMLKRNKCKKKVYIDGLAASAASIIAMAGDEIIMPKNTLMMIHNPATWVSGESKDFRKAADMLDKLKDAGVSAYMAKTKKSKEEINKIMDEETWLTAEDAVSLGFADRVDDFSVTIKVEEESALVGNMQFARNEIPNYPAFLKSCNNRGVLSVENKNESEDNKPKLNERDLEMDKCNCPEKVESLIKSGSFSEHDKPFLLTMNASVVEKLVEVFVKNEEEAEVPVEVKEEVVTESDEVVESDENEETPEIEETLKQIDSKESLEEQKSIFSESFFDYLSSAVKLLEDKKAQVIGNISKNPRNKFSFEVLNNKSLDELEAISALASDVVDYSLANTAPVASVQLKAVKAKGLPMPGYNTNLSKGDE